MTSSDDWSAFAKSAAAEIPPPPRRVTPAPRPDLAVVPDAVDDVDEVEGADLPGPPAAASPAVEAESRATFHADGIDAALATPHEPAASPAAPEDTDQQAPAREEEPPGQPVPQTRALDQGPARTPAPAAAPAGAPTGATVPSAPSAPDTVSAAGGTRAGASSTGGRMTAAQLRARRVANQHTSHVMSILRTHGVETPVLSSSVSGRQVQVVLACSDELLDPLLDAIADGLVSEGVEVEVGDGEVTLWLGVRDEEPAKQKSIWVPAVLRERVRAHTERTGESVSQLVLRAFNTYHDKVGDMFTAESMPEGPLAIPTAKRRLDVDTPVQLWLYWRRSHEDEIDAAVKDCGAGSRSALLTVLLTRYLDAVEPVS